jgi:EmrB/QacA subfamily drug resistance transporter
MVARAFRHRAGTISFVRSSAPWHGVALLVAGAFFMENLDGTIIATAAPRMAASLGVRSVDLNVVITAYLLTLAVFIPVSGWIADRVGARTVFAAAIALFTVASGLCALSTSLGELTAVRVLQGIGGAMMVPVGRLVVLRSTARADLIDAIAYLTWPALAAPVIAPALGGVLTTYASWRWIFVVNLPLGVLAFAIAMRIIPNVRVGAHVALDWRGFALTGVGLAALVYGLELCTASRVEWAVVAASLGVAVVSLSIAARHLQRALFPLMSLDALRIPTFRVMAVGGSFFRLAIGAVPFLLPLMFQDAFGWTSLKSGLLVVAVFVGNIGIKPATGPLLRRFGFRRVLVVAGVGAGVTVLLCGLLTAHTQLAVIVLVLLSSGVFRSIAFTAYNTIAFADIAAEDVGNANTLSATMQQLTMGLGVAVGALALRAGGPIARVFGASGTGASPFAAGFVIVAAFAFVAVADSALLRSDAGAAIIATPDAKIVS